jgi:hypothetical protein
MFFCSADTGASMSEHVPWFARVVPRVDRLLARWRWARSLCCAYLWIRTGGPDAWAPGRCRYGVRRRERTRRSDLAVVIAAIGYTAGQAIEGLLGNVVHVEKLVLGWSSRSRSRPSSSARCRRRSTRRQ